MQDPRLAGAADFLVVRFDRIGNVGMNDETNLASIDAHSECIRCHDHALRRAHELVLHGLSLRLGQAGMVRRGFDAGAAEAGVDIVDILSRSCVHNAERRPSGQLDDAPDFFGVCRDLLDFEIQIGPVKAAHDFRRSLDSKLCNDVRRTAGVAVAVSARTGGDFESEIARRRRK